MQYNTAQDPALQAQQFFGARGAETLSSARADDLWSDRSQPLTRSAFRETAQLGLQAAKQMSTLGRVALNLDIEEDMSCFSHQSNLSGLTGTKEKK